MHSNYIKIALRLAKRNLGLTHPNPSVACIIVKNDKIISTGVTAIGGRPHAEAVALSKLVNVDLSNATAYVTLEPCSFVGKTPACADLLIKSGISNVVIATIDPYHKVAGKGIDKLKQAGVNVVVGVCEEQANKLNEGFFSVVEKKRPFITLKLATSANAKIAKSNGDSKWITSAKTREYAHLLRARHDAILVGANTVRFDNPTLDCRLPGMANYSPTRIIFDRNIRINEDSNIFKTSKKIDTIIISYENDRSNILSNYNIKNIVISQTETLKSILEKIANIGITKILVEGGSQIAASFLKEDLVDKIIWMKADKIIEESGIDAVAGDNLNDICQDKFDLSKSFNIETDEVMIFDRKF